MTDKSKDLLRKFYNPFSQTKLMPKIPDGEGIESMGQQNHIVKQVNIKPETSPIYILVHPGYTSNVAIQNVWGQIDPNHRKYNMAYDDAGGDTTGYVGVYDDGNFTFTGTLDGATHLIQGNGSTLNFGKNDNAIAKQRLVSAGLKITFESTEDTKNGWFEAVRLPFPDDLEDIHFKDGSDLSQDDWENLKAIIAWPDLISVRKGNGQTRENLADSDSYIQGNLNDIDKYTFRLNPTTNKIRFKNTKKNVPLLPAGQPANTLATDRFAFQADNSDHNGKYIKDLWFDTDFDCILIKVHFVNTIQQSLNALATPPGDDTHRLVLHSTNNTESVYDPTATYAKFMTKTVQDNDYSNTVTQMLQENSAALILP